MLIHHKYTVYFLLLLNFLRSLKPSRENVLLLNMKYLKVFFFIGLFILLWFLFPLSCFLGSIRIPLTSFTNFLQFTYRFRYFFLWNMAPVLLLFYFSLVPYVAVTMIQILDVMITVWLLQEHNVIIFLFTVPFSNNSFFLVRKIFLSVGEKLKNEHF